MGFKILAINPGSTSTKVALYDEERPSLDLTLLAGFQNLQEVDFFGSTVSHPEALVGLSSLRNVNLGETGVRDLSFLSSMQALTDLDLRNNTLSDLTPLLENTDDNVFIILSDNEVDIDRILAALSPRHQPLAHEQLSQAPFEIVYRE